MIPLLTITPIRNDDLVHEYKLSGQIDVSAGPVLTNLSEATFSAMCVVLDFSEIERINSMGLAQLMKALEFWRGRKIRIEVRNLNRMVSMLFKMTGLNRYFNDPPAGVADDMAQPAAQAKAEASPSGQIRQIKRIRVIPEQAAQAADSKLEFSVSLQNNQQLTGWFVFNTFLQRHLEKAIHIDVKQPGQTSQLNQNALVFAKPFDACVLISEHQFIPVARPANDSDEVSIIVRQADAEKALGKFAGAKVVTAVETDFMYLLGRFLCDEYELDSSQLQYAFTGNEIKALQTLLRGQADMLFMPKKNYHQLSRLSREGTYVLAESETAMSYHMLLVSPRHAALKHALTDTLYSMHKDEKGSQVLTDLGISSWCEPEQDEIAMLLMLYKRYAGNTEACMSS